MLNFQAKFLAKIFSFLQVLLLHYSMTILFIDFFEFVLASSIVQENKKQYQYQYQV